MSDGQGDSSGRAEDEVKRLKGRLLFYTTAVQQRDVEIAFLRREVEDAMNEGGNGQGNLLPSRNHDAKKSLTATFSLSSFDTTASFDERDGS